MRSMFEALQTSSSAAQRMSLQSLRRFAEQSSRLAQSSRSSSLEPLWESGLRLQVPSANQKVSGNIALQHSRSLLLSTIVAVG